MVWGAFGEQLWLLHFRERIGKALHRGTVADFVFQSTARCDFGSPFTATSVLDTCALADAAKMTTTTLNLVNFTSTIYAGKDLGSGLSVDNVSRWNRRPKPHLRVRRVHKKFPGGELWIWYILLRRSGKTAPSQRRSRAAVLLIRHHDLLLSSSQGEAK
jgi:hypothetical protein